MVFENNFPHDKKTFSEAAWNGNLGNMKWLLKNNFTYDEYVFFNTIRKNSKNIKWLLQNKFTYEDIFLDKWVDRNGNFIEKKV